MSIRLLARLADPVAAVIPDAELLSRFAETRDEAAFELLVWRHAGLVLGTCRRVLGRAPDADDAFQATFLALARRAGSVRGPHLPGWLHRVAHRAAVRLRTRTARTRPDPEALASATAREVPLPDDTAAVLDEEIARLPDKLRAAFVLCELEGRTDADAAAHLGCPVGTVQSRLFRARERLRARLTRRGLAVAALGALTGPTPLASAALVAATVRGAVPFATGGAIVGPSPGAVALAREISRATLSQVLRPFAALALVALAGAGAVGAARAPDPAPPAPTAPAPAPRVAAQPPQPPAQPARPAPLDTQLATARHGLKFVSMAQFTRDGKWIIASGMSPRADRGFDQVVVVWDAATGKHAHTFTEADGGGGAPDVSPDGKFLALAGAGNGAVSVWAVGTWKKVWTVKQRFAGEVQFSPDGKALYTRARAAGGNQMIDDTVVRDAASGKKRFAPAPGRGESFGTVQFAPDGRLAVGVSTGAVRFLDPVTGKTVGELKAPSTPDGEFAFAPDGKRALTWVPAPLQPDPAGAAPGVRLWDVAAGKVERVVAGDHPTSFAWFSPDGARVWTAAPGGEVRVWDAATGKAVVEFKPPAEGAMFSGVSPDGKLAVAGWRDPNTLAPTCALFDAVTGKEVARLPGVRGLDFSPDGASAVVVRGAGFAAGNDDPDALGVRPVAELLKFKPPAKK